MSEHAPSQNQPTSSDLGLDGAVALVTGAASGIGRAAAHRLADAGATVVVADLDAEAGRQAAEAIGGRSLALDVSDPQSWTRALDALDALDVVLLNAGVTTGKSDLGEVSLEEYRWIVGVNLDGVVLGLRAVLPLLRARGGGDVIATASLAGLGPMPHDPLYTATKHAVVGLVRSAAPPLAEEGIRVNAVCPGFTDTPIVREPLRSELGAAGLPLLGAEDVAEAIAAILAAGGSGEAWFVQPGRAPAPYAFGGLPGPRPTAGRPA